jgi:hypothetical protein
MVECCAYCVDCGLRIVDYCICICIMIFLCSLIDSLEC